MVELMLSQAMLKGLASSATVKRLEQFGIVQPRCMLLTVRHPSYQNLHYEDLEKSTAKIASKALTSRQQWQTLHQPGPAKSMNVSWLSR